MQKDKQQISDVLKEYITVMNDKALLPVTFVTVSEYLFLLKEAACALRPMGSNAILFLAAAVSDFYLPEAKMVCFFNSLKQSGL